MAAGYFFIHHKRSPLTHSCRKFIHSGERIMTGCDKHDPYQKQRGEEKFARIPIKIVPTKLEDRKRLPDWIRIKAPVSPAVGNLKQLLRDHKLVTVCEEAACPNLSECFSHGTATFMIMGDKCT